MEDYGCIMRSELPIIKVYVQSHPLPLLATCLSPKQFGCCNLVPLRLEHDPLWQRPKAEKRERKRKIKYVDYLFYFHYHYITTLPRLAYDDLHAHRATQVKNKVWVLTANNNGKTSVTRYWQGKDRGSQLRLDSTQLASWLALFVLSNATLAGVRTDECDFARHHWTTGDRTSGGRETGHT